jgi:hypothetical protein
VTTSDPILQALGARVRALGTPEAVAGRESVPDEVALRILERSKQLVRECDCGGEGMEPRFHRLGCPLAEVKP